MKNKVALLRITLMILFLTNIGFSELESQFELNLRGVVNKDFDDFRIGDTIQLLNIEDLYNKKVIRYGMEQLGYLNLSALQRIDVVIGSSREFWLNEMLKADVFTSSPKNESILKQESEIDALEYLSYIESNNLGVNDLFLESYIHGLLYDIFPGSLMDYNRGNFNVKIVKDLIPNAFIFPNGSLIITTGLLSTLKSEDHLKAVLAHEVAHLLLDHAIVNIGKQEQREKRAIFWASVATVISGVAEGVYASNVGYNNPYYTPGLFTAAMATISFSLAAAVNERMGLEYEFMQEIQANQCAMGYLKFIGLNGDALATSYRLIKEYYDITGNRAAIIENNAHPNFNPPMKVGNINKEINSIPYDKLMASILSLSAVGEFEAKHFKRTEELIFRLINAGMARGGDYLLLAKTNLFQHNSAEENERTLSYILQAESLDPDLIFIPKIKAIVLDRLSRDKEAMAEMKRYLGFLQDATGTIQTSGFNPIINLDNSELTREIVWAERMLRTFDN